jgi:sulfur carrier protein ThiS
MRILFLNHDGGGFADHIEIEPGTTVDTLFRSQLKGAEPRDYLIRVNRQPVTAGQQLQEGDRVSITPRKIEGAA